jgi:hypothetical protein
MYRAWFINVPSMVYQCTVHGLSMYQAWFIKKPQGLKARQSSAQGNTL